MKGFPDRTYYPADIEAASGGIFDRKTQQMDHYRQKWLTPTTSPKAGYPREYTQAHMEEAAIVGACVRHGLTPAQGRQVLHERAFKAAIEKERKRRDGSRPGTASVFEGEVAQAISDLPEFQDVDSRAPVFWLALMTQGLDPYSTAPFVESVTVIGPNAAVGDIMTATAGRATKRYSLAILINVTQVLYEARVAVRKLAFGGNDASATNTDEEQ